MLSPFFLIKTEHLWKLIVKLKSYPESFNGVNSVTFQHYCCDFTVTSSGHPGSFSCSILLRHSLNGNSVTQWIAHWPSYSSDET